MAPVQSQTAAQHADGGQQHQPAAPPPWQILGRSSAAGKALYTLYGGDLLGRKQGNTFSQNNLARVQARKDAGWMPPPPGRPARAKAPVKPRLAVPRVGQAWKAASSCCPPNQAGGKRRADVILQELAAQELARESAPPPLPRGPLLDAAEKERCAQAMQFRGRPPAPAPAPPRPCAVQRGSPAELEQLFDRVLQEIRERKAFLAEMQGVMRPAEFQQTANSLRREIGERVQELQRLDQLIKEQA